MEPLTPISTVGSSNLTISSTPMSRYGEPCYSARPVENEDGTLPIERTTYDKCYEELELERRHVNITADPNATAVFRNSSIMQAGPATLVEIVVGSTSWHLNRALLNSRSSFFKAALDNNDTTKLILTEYHPSVFTFFVQYLYTTTFDAPNPSDFVGTYILGSKLGAYAFKNKAIDKLYTLNHWKCTFTASDIDAIFFNTDIECGLRRLAVDSIALGFLTQELNVKAEEWKEALRENDGWSEVITSMAQQHLQTWKSKTQGEYHDVF